MSGRSLFNIACRSLLGINSDRRRNNSSISAQEELETRVVPTRLYTVLPAPITDGTSLESSTIKDTCQSPEATPSSSTSSSVNGRSKSVTPQKLQFSAADVRFTVSNSVDSPVTVEIYSQAKKNPEADLELHSEKTIKPGKSKSLRSAVIYDPNDEKYDFILRLVINNSQIFSMDYRIVTDTVPSAPHGDQINPKQQQIDIALLPPHDLRVSVNPRS